MLWRAISPKALLCSSRALAFWKALVQSFPKTCNMPPSMRDDILSPERQHSRVPECPGTRSNFGESYLMTHNSKSRVLWTHGCVLKQGFQPCKTRHQVRPEHNVIACCLLGTPLGHFTLSLAKPGASLPGSSRLTTVFGHPLERDVTLTPTKQRRCPHRQSLLSTVPSS